MFAIPTAFATEETIDDMPLEMFLLLKRVGVPLVQSPYAPPGIVLYATPPPQINQVEISLEWPREDLASIRRELFMPSRLRFGG
jgi:hypothetical protein